MVAKTADGGGRMMLRMPMRRTASSHARNRSAVTSSGQATAAVCRATSSRMARLDRLAQMSDQPVEGLVFGHGDVARPREIDRKLVDDRGRPAPHDEDAVG